MSATYVCEKEPVDSLYAGDNCFVWLAEITQPLIHITSTPDPSAYASLSVSTLWEQSSASYGFALHGKNLNSMGYPIFCVLSGNRWALLPPSTHVYMANNHYRHRNDIFVNTLLLRFIECFLEIISHHVTRTSKRLVTVISLTYSFIFNFVYVHMFMSCTRTDYFPE